MKEIGYIELLKTNGRFRIFWAAAVISMIGEWFNTIALFTLILKYSGSEALLGLLFTIRMLGFAILQPITGLLADRWSRKWIMVVSNLVQVVLALCFLMVNGPEDIWWLIGLSGVMMVLHGAYMTAERAALPNIVSEEELATANALDAATWSTALAIGAFLGGIVVSQYGVNTAFIIDAITFLVGALILLPLKLPQNVSEDMKGPIFKTAIRNIKAGFTRLFDEPRLKRIVFAKTTWNLAGGGLAAVFLVIAGSRMSPGEMAAGIGLFFMARGIGTGIGPIVARKFLTNKSRWPSLIGILVSVSGFFYLIIGLTIFDNLYLTITLIILAHAASGANWVLSTILTQQWVEDEVRGRVFSIDMLLMSVSFSISTYFAGWLLDNSILSLKTGMVYFACAMMIFGIIFTLWRPDVKHNNSLNNSIIS
ncbi:MAG: MFS transporter [Candidatus Poseidoniales archaeon]|nr:MAG: MFS transporter [Candidatus Poseidoniales archaeon]